MAKKQFKKGDIILKEGTTGNEMYIILSGKARVYKTINRKPTELGFLGPDDFFGEMSLFLHHPRSATVEAMEKIEIMTFNRESFLDIVKSDPELAAQIITILVKRLHEAHNVIIRLEGEKKSLKVMYGMK